MFSLVSHVVAISVMCCSFAVAATVKFTPAKSTFVPEVEEVELTCELEESKVQSKNVEQVVSIVIKKVNKGSEQLVATVSDYSPAKFAADQKNVEVHGDVSGTKGKKREKSRDLKIGRCQEARSNPSYLRLKWTRPTLAIAGQYKCYINVIHASHLHESLSSTARIDANEPTTKDLVTIIAKLETEVKQLKEKESKNNNDQVKNLNELRADLGEKIQKVGHTETGIEIFGDSDDTWTRQSKSVFVHFKTAYTRKPAVILSVMRIDANTHSHNLRLQCSVGEVRLNGFHFTCLTWGNTGFSSFNVGWMSVANLS